jgi:hypothetical protein
MSDIDATLDECVRHTGVERYRWLCSDANDLPAPNSRDDWRRWVIERRWDVHPVAGVAVDYTPVTPGPCGGCPGG